MKHEVYKNLTHLILDEVHEREKVTDFLLIAIREALQANPHLKVILMSATLDSQQFSEYFSNCPVIDVPGRLFDVKIMHLDEVTNIIGYKKKEIPNGLQPGKKHSNDDEDEIDHELLQKCIMHIHTEKPIDGSILVFLPGFKDIMMQKKMIETKFHMNNYELFVLHSGVNGIKSREQSNVFNRMPPGIRKIILSTNIAETSLTINDVVCCVNIFFFFQIEIKTFLSIFVIFSTLKFI